MLKIRKEPSLKMSLFSFKYDILWCDFVLINFVSVTGEDHFFLFYL